MSIKQNFLSPIEFRFVIERLPYVTFFTQSLTLPGLNAQPVETATPFKKIYHTPDTLTYDEFSVNFRVNENMDNYLEIKNWLTAITFPESYAQYRDINSSEQSLYSDATVILMSNGRNPNMKYKFKDIFPIALSGIDMDTTTGDIEYVTSTATFQIASYEIETYG